MTLLPVTELSVSANEFQWAMPPPALVAELPETRLLFVSVVIAVVYTPPPVPLPAALFDTVDSFSSNVQLLLS